MMKKAGYTLLLLFTAACTQTYKSVTVGPLTLPALPQAGEQIALQYDVDSPGHYSIQKDRLLGEYRHRSKGAVQNDRKGQ